MTDTTTAEASTSGGAPPVGATSGSAGATGPAGPPAGDARDLAGRTVLVTGGGQGVGRGVAALCAQRGARIVVNDYHLDRAAAVCAEIGAAGGEALALRCDVSDYDDVTAMVEHAVSRFGRIDVLVNNAGNAGPAAGSLFDQPPFWETDPTEWTRWLSTNLFGVLNVTRACLPHMVQHRWGRVVTVISDAGRVGEANLVVYGGAKAGAAGFSRGLAKAVGRHGVTVNCVALGSMNTASVAEVTGDPKLLKQVLSGYSIRRLGEPDDAAQMIAFLASDAASWITGQTYPVNGGYSVAT
jgi:NAD(P)-dependent dehydrogenase (short-subunit alcohol dehydrogenase family)